MDKRAFTLIILAVIASSFTIGFTISLLQHTPQTLEKKYEKLAHEVLAETSRLRGLPPPENFEVKAVSSSWVLKHWASGESTSSESLEWKIYRALLLVPAESSPQEFETSWVKLIIAASSGETLYIVWDRMENLSKAELLRILAHESTHILQYVNFDQPQPETYDGRQALAALIEGDADLTADSFLEAKGLKPPLRQLYRPEKFGYRDAVFLLRYFPYQYGESFVAYLRSHGGWKLVNEAYSNPPRSAEQVMHPEKYLEGEEFAEPETPKIGDSWVLLGEDRLGEYFIQVYLARWIGWDEAVQASEGWNGDKACYYEDGDGGFLLVWVTMWDSSKDAKEYLEALTHALGEAGGVKVSAELWRIGETYMAVKSSNDKVTLISTNRVEALEAIV